jgi:Flp pilus assembly pilin Flp
MLKYSMIRSKAFLKEKGQTSVEYILMIAVISVIASGIFSKFEKYIYSNPDSMINTYIGGLSDVFGNSGSGQFKYKRFILRR